MFPYSTLLEHTLEPKLFLEPPKKSHTDDEKNPANQLVSWYGKYPFIVMVSYMPGGWEWDFSHQVET